MKLLYWKEARGNFGDDLNPILWPRLLPGILDGDESCLFVGIGTLLTDALPKEPLKVVFGSGAWLGRTLPVLDHTYRIYCVRGPLTAEVLGLERTAAITDPAVLVRSMPRPGVPRRHKVSYMPHHWSQDLGNWREVCELAGLHYIDPGRPAEDVLAEIEASEMLITEAMHGAIVADAVRVPWLAVRGYDHILAFKWRDWCYSLGMEYKPVSLPSLWNFKPPAGALARLRDRVKKGFLVRKLRHLCRHGTPQLSSDAALDAACGRLQEKLESFVADVRAGQFACRRGSMQSDFARR